MKQKIQELKAIITAILSDDENVDGEVIEEIVGANQMNQIETILCTDKLKRHLDDAISIYFRS